jgi:hypothetical protein
MTPIPQLPRPHGRSPVDRVVTVLLCALAALAALGSVLASFFFVMATDSCGTDNCDFSKITWAYVVTWGGIGLAVVIAVVGVIAAARRRTVMWVWPALAFFVVIVALAGGAALAVDVVN